MLAPPSSDCNLRAQIPQKKFGQSTVTLRQSRESDTSGVVVGLRPGISAIRRRSSKKPQIQLTMPLLFALLGFSLAVACATVVLFEISRST
jgi:hypothetical protein